MSEDRPTPAEAARALQEAEHRKDQVVASVRESRWVAVVFGIVLFLYLAAPDFFGPEVTKWTSPVLAVLSVTYAVLLNTRRGSALLGRPTRLRKEEISPRFAAAARGVLLLALVVGIVAAFVPHPDLPLPYWRTVAGVLLGGFVIIFGRRCEQALLSFARRGSAEGNGAGWAHGSR
jgi:peptidoglycan/LPS O-acetylase OafA/YrhL